MKVHKWRISIIETIPTTWVFRDQDSKLSWSVKITEIYPWAALEMSFHNVGRTHLGSSEIQTTDRTNFQHPFSVCCLQTLSPCLFFPHFLLYLVPLAHFLHQMRVFIQGTLAPCSRWAPFKSDLGYSLTMEQSMCPAAQFAATLLSYRSLMPTQGQWPCCWWMDLE